MERHNQEPVLFADVKDEIFDMVRPKDPLKITLQDLIECGQGETVVSILIDLNGFWTYENREVLVTDNLGSNSANKVSVNQEEASHQKQMQPVKKAAEI